MRLPALPEVLRLTPSQLADTEGPPVFLMAPLTHREQVKYAAKLARADVPGDVLLDLFADQCRGAEQLTIWDEPFDPKNEAHLQAVPAGFQNDVADQVLAYASLTDVDLGKSPSQSGSS